MDGRLMLPSDVTIVAPENLVAERRDRDAHQRGDPVEEAVGEVGDGRDVQDVDCVMPQLLQGKSGEVTVAESSTLRLSSRRS